MSKSKALEDLWNDTERIRKLLLFVHAVRSVITDSDYGLDFFAKNQIDRVHDALNRLDAEI